ncbi:CEO family-domain-containing protein [Ochromonadaceae sp. CCMP2298]|nr:CEO family-domain-containing protein [Ochromonadaceae sp. CCMP2298]|mmetsp:Transcript_4680/g.10513  ORF Transcript_4680/g.10513 Transcript_4680/m.10513 type:complete len:409 (-) Transcript_4680:851-2077(-)
MSALGYGAALVAVICLGSNFVPLKRVRIGDGVFFQFIMCNSLFMTAIPVLLIQGSPPVHGLAFLGGAVWCTGNILCPIAIKFIGLGLSLILWGCTSMLCGWASGTFGLFGLKRQEISDPMMNTAGVIMSLCGFCIYMFVRSEDTSVDAKKFRRGKERNSAKQPLLSLESEGTDACDEDYDESSVDTDDSENSRLNSSLPADRHHLLNLNDTVYNPLEEGLRNADLRKDSMMSQYSVISMKSRSIGDDWSEERKRAVGMGCAIVAGIFFGCSFDPAQYIIDNRYDGNDNSLNYVFSQFVGIIGASWGYTMIYCIYQYCIGKQPYINGDAILPATLSGLIRGVALIAWFIANGELGFPVTFPIVTTGPGLVGALWGIFLFKEIKGWRDLTILASAATVTAIAVTLIALSH